jgi:hypothetical protein
MQQLHWLSCANPVAVVPPLKILWIKSLMSLSLFLVAIATKMETQVTLLTAIGYIPSYKPKSSKLVPKLLEDEESYEGMMEDIQDYIDSCRAKNKGKGKVKPFSICIYDTLDTLDPNAVKVNYFCCQS